MILAAANAYLGLFAGLTIATAIPAAVVSMGVLRLLGGGTILENNIVQTGASAGSSIAAGVIFTIPALVILGYWQDFRYSWVLAIAGLGGLLGVLFSVPLRRSMIVEDPLPFPEGKAAAEVLKAGENPGPGLKILGLSAGAIGALVKLAAESGLRMIPDNAVGAGLHRQVPRLHGHQPVAGAARRRLHRRPEHRHRRAVGQHPVLEHRDPDLPRLLPRAAIRRWPRAIAGASAAEAAGAIWSAKIRYLGVGAMLIGGVWTLFSLRKSLLSGIKSGIAAARKGARRRSSPKPSATCR